MTALALLESHRQALLGCRRCSRMIGPVVAGPAIESRVLLLGQAPGPHEGEIGRPFAWTAGATLFRWLASLGIEEQTFRDSVFMAALCRCFPGKSRGGGDRVPSKLEIAECSFWLRQEIDLLQPDLLIPVGRLAIAQVIKVDRLVDVIGSRHRVSLFGHDMDAIPLPHPSGASTWHRTEPGRSLLEAALALLGDHPAMRFYS